MGWGGAGGSSFMTAGPFFYFILFILFYYFILPVRSTYSTTYNPKRYKSPYAYVEGIFNIPSRLVNEVYISLFVVLEPVLNIKTLLIKGRLIIERNLFKHLKSSIGDIVT